MFVPISCTIHLGTASAAGTAKSTINNASCANAGLAVWLNKENAKTSKMRVANSWLNFRNGY